MPDAANISAQDQITVPPRAWLDRLIAAFAVAAVAVAGTAGLSSQPAAGPGADVYQAIRSNDIASAALRPIST